MIDWNSEDQAFISGLVEADEMPELGQEDMTKLQDYLKATRQMSATYDDPANNDCRRILKIILHYNSYSRIFRGQGTTSATCDDAQVLLDFATGIADLTTAIDILHREGDGPRDHALRIVRDLVIHDADRLHKKVAVVRDALIRQGILTAERKDSVINLSQSLDFIAHILKASLANDWGYRVTEEAAPPEVVQEWNGHWHTIRHTAINMKHWAEGMVDGTEASLGAYVENEPQESDETSPIVATKVGNAGMSWQDAKKAAEEHVKAHDGAFPSVMRLAEIVGCSRPTIDKAISRSTYLKARKAEKSKPVRNERMTDISLEQASQQVWREDKSEQARRDDELERLIAEQEADQALDDRQEKAAKKRRT